MRLGDREREQLFEQLNRHAADGRLDLAELERRVGLVAAAETHEEAAEALRDLPPLPDAGTSAGGHTPRSEGVRRRRGHGEADAPSPDWQPTNERFRDPRSGSIIRVWVDAIGGRHYVKER